MTDLRRLLHGMHSSAASYWAVVRREDGAKLARYTAKPKAVSAALRFDQDGYLYDVIQEPTPEARQVIIPLKGP